MTEAENHLILIGSARGPFEVDQQVQVASNRAIAAEYETFGGSTGQDLECITALGFPDGSCPVRTPTLSIYDDSAWHAARRAGIFNVRIVREGDKYGPDNRLTHDKDEPLVEFYDSRYPHTPFGQFVSRYNLSTFMESSNGINLYGGVPEWYVTGEEVKQLQQWLREGETK